jgi:hypothetical protein
MTHLSWGGQQCDHEVKHKHHLANWQILTKKNGTWTMGVFFSEATGGVRSLALLIIVYIKLPVQYYIQ